MSWNHTVGDRQFDNKLLAIQESNKTNNPILFNTPDTYKSFDFAKEPTQNLQTLLKEEAEKIRDTHKKVRLYFSGGSDSHLMLKTFVDNKIHFDEIICLKSGIPNADYEIDDYALPLLKSFDVASNKVKINTPTHLDYDEYYRQDIEPKIQKGLFTYNTHFRLIAQDELFHEQNYEPSTANLRGFDKPKIIKVDDNWYTYFLDVDIETFSHTINFFSDNPMLQAKQAHLFQQAIQSVDESNIWSKQKIWNESTGRQNTLEKTLFHDKDDCFFDVKNYRVHYINLKEKQALQWAIDTKQNSLTHWTRNLEQLREWTDNKWWNNKHPEMGTVGIFSKFYGITTKETKTVDELFPNGFKT